MNTSAKVGISIASVFVVFIVFLISSYFGYANDAVDFEVAVEAGVEDNRQQLGQYRLSVVEATSVLGLGSDLQGDSVTKQIEARYGKGGSNAAMQWITENNHAGVSQEVMVGIQRQIQAGRTDFTAAQKRLLDICRGYKRLQRQPYSRFWLGMSGYPSDEYNDVGGNGTLCRAVTSAGAKSAFESGVEEALDLRGKPEA
jgi:hypothetical protein